MLPSRFMSHYLYWHTYRTVSCSLAGVAMLVRHDSQLHIGDYTHYPEGRAIVLRVIYRDKPIQIVNVHMSAKGTAKEYPPLLKWPRAHMAPTSRMVLLGGDFHRNTGRSPDCVFVHTEIAAVLLEFVANMHLQPFMQCMQGPTWFNAQGFAGKLDFFPRL